MKAKKKHQEIANVIEAHHGKPMVSSLKIAELLERPHDQVLRAIRKVENTQRGLDVLVESYLNEQNKEQPLYWLGERSSLIVMPYVGGDKSVEGQTKLVDAYLHYRDNFKEPPRKDLLHAKRDEHAPMTDMLKFTRELMGKDTGRNHYINENKFCNRALTGKWEALDETALDNYDLALLAAIRRHNTLLIAHFPAQADRKERLDVFVTEYRAKRPRLRLVGQDG